MKLVTEVRRLEDPLLKMCDDHEMLFFGSDRSPRRGIVVCVRASVRACVRACVTLFKRMLKMSSSSILKSLGGF